MRTLVTLALLALPLAACGPDVGGGDGDDTAGCTGGDVRCNGNLYEVCEDGQYVTGEACALACSVDLGCVECDPAAGNACNGNDVVACNADGTLGGTIETCTDGTTCNAGECSRECTADGVDLIYVVDESYRLLSFDPRLLEAGQEPFALVGNLSCPASPTPVPGWLGGVTPFSMSVDRNALAWVLYSSGEIFNVTTNNASCSATGFAPLQAGGEWALFGMGYVTDSAGGNTEKLYIGGGDPMATPGGRFGYIQQPSLAVQDVGNLPSDGEYSPEFTGTGNGELFGFYPGVSEAFVQQIDKNSGAAVGNKMQIPGGLGGLGVEAWAFAHWGGKFYIFVTVDGNSMIHRIDRATGAYDGLLRSNLPYIIVGAGVSTCAPVVVE